MTYADDYNIRTTSVKFNDVANALDGLITRNYAGLTTGTSTAYVATPTPAWTAYTTSGLVVIIPHVSNSGAATINISGLGSRDLKIGNAAIAAGVLQQNVPTIMAYTGTYFEVLLQNVSIPIGTIYTYAGASAPTGYLLCDGSPQSTTGAYAALHGVIGYTYGGSGGTFNLPDLQRRVPIGKGASDTLGGNDGIAYASRSANQSHSVPAHYHSMGAGADLNITSSGGGGTTGSTTVSISNSTTGISVNSSTTGAAVNGWGAATSLGNGNYAARPSTGAGSANNTGMFNDPGHVHGITDPGHGHTLTNGTHSHTTPNHTHSSGDFSGRVGLVTGGVDGNAAMASGAGQYLYINYIIKT